MAAVIPAISTDEMKLVSAQACEAGEKFVKLFYETYDKRRHMLGKLYLDTASLIWNGNAVSGPADITKFLDALPGSEHMIECTDTQPIPSAVTQGHTTILVTTSGTVKYQNNPVQNFTQNFMLTSIDNKWKIVSDAMRATT